MTTATERNAQEYAIKKIAEMIDSGNYPLVKSDPRDRGTGISRYAKYNQGLTTRRNK